MTQPIISDMLKYTIETNKKQVNYFRFRNKNFTKKEKLEALYRIIQIQNHTFISSVFCQHSKCSLMSNFLYIP